MTRRHAENKGQTRTGERARYGRQGGGPMGRLRRPKERAKDVRGTVIRIWDYMKRQKGALAITALLVIVSSGLGALGPYLERVMHFAP